MFLLLEFTFFFNIFLFRMQSDIAARNIFIDRALTPRIGDFGLAIYGNDPPVLEDAPHSKWLAPEVQKFCFSSFFFFF